MLAHVDVAGVSFLDQAFIDLVGLHAYIAIDIDETFMSIFLYLLIEVNLGHSFDSR